MSHPFTDLIQWMHSELRDCPPALMIQHARHAVIEFCRMTNAWRRELPAISIVAGTTTYALAVDDPVDEAVIQSIMGVEIDGEAIRAGSEYRWSQDKSTIELVYSPAVSMANALKVEVSLKPSAASVELQDDRLFEDWHDTFVHGALHTLMMQKDKPWTNMELSEAHRLKFLNGIGKAVDELRRRRLNVLPTARATYGFI
jgi:hypothetical protein